MPSSAPCLIPYVCSVMTHFKPKSVLDVGMGNGKYGFLAREYIDIQNAAVGNNDKCYLHGIEIFRPYIGKVQKAIYDKISIGSAMEVLNTIEEKYDLVICCDMIEHLEKKDGHRLIRRMRRCLSDDGILLVTTPIKEREQGVVFGNENETHLCIWDEHDFDMTKPDEVNTVDDSFYIIFWGGTPFTEENTKQENQNEA